MNPPQKSWLITSTNHKTPSCEKHRSIRCLEADISLFGADELKIEL